MSEIKTAAEPKDHAHESAIEGLLCRDSSCKWVLPKQPTTAVLASPDSGTEAAAETRE